VLFMVTDHLKNRSEPHERLDGGLASGGGFDFMVGWPAYVIQSGMAAPQRLHDGARPELLRRP